MHPPSKIILNNSHNSVTTSVLDAWARIINKDQQIKLATVEKFKLTGRTLLYQNYWKNIYQKQGDVLFTMDKLEGRLSLQAITTCREVVRILQRRGDSRDSVEDKFEPGGPVVSASCAHLSFNFTWTSRIYTLATQVAEAEMKFANLVPPYKPKYALMFRGHSYPGSKVAGGNDTWIHLILQFPSGPETQFVPPILFLRMGSADFFFVPGLIPLLKSLLGPEPQEPALLTGCEDSGFRSSEPAGGGDPVDKRCWPSKEVLPELIKSAIVNVKTEALNLYTSEEFSLAFTSDSMTETVNKLTTIKAGIGILRNGIFSSVWK